VRPELHWVQAPVVSSHLVHPDPHFSQLPEELRKNPSWQEAHWVELPPEEAVTNPGEQVQVDPLQTPLAQLQLDGALEGTATLRHSPVPVMPSSHRLQVGSHCLQSGP
jgi:hypothetical protein